MLPEPIKRYPSRHATGASRSVRRTHHNACGTIAPGTVTSRDLPQPPTGPVLPRTVLPNADEGTSVGRVPRPQKSGPGHGVRPSVLAGVTSFLLYCDVPRFGGIGAR